MSSSYTEDGLVEQPAVQLMQHELGWDVVNCYDDPTSLTILRRGFERQELRRSGWTGGVSNQGRDGKPSSPPRPPRLWRSRRLRRSRREVALTGRLKPALQRLHPELPVAAIEGAVEENGILNDGFWILNGRGGRSIAHRLNRLHLALSLAEAGLEIDKHRRPSSEVLFALEPDRLCNRLVINEFLFELKTSVADSPLGETQRLSEIPVRKLMKSLFSRDRENCKIVKIGLSFTENGLFTTT